MALQSIYQPELPFCEFTATDLCVSRHVSQQLILSSSTPHPVQKCEKICANEFFSVPLQRERKTKKNKATMKAKPFVKWVGGKTQLIEQVCSH